MPYRSSHRFARISARKARLVVDMIRGLGVGDAQAALEYSKKRAAVMVGTCLKSAIHNAEFDEEADIDLRSLVITEARVDEGPTIKRWQPKDRGRAHPILKRTCHIHIAVDAK